MKPAHLLLPALGFAIFMFYLFSAVNTSSPVEPQAKTYGQFINIYGETVELNDYFGKYLWVDYAAEWCSYCDPQTETLQYLAGQYGGKIDFLTIVTGTRVVMEAPTMHTLRAWTDRHNLDPGMVIGRFYTDRLPYNLLYSPEGNVLYRGSGLLQEDEIRRIIFQHTDY